MKNKTISLNKKEVKILMDSLERSVDSFRDDKDVYGKYIKSMENLWAKLVKINK